MNKLQLIQQNLAEQELATTRFAETAEFYIKQTNIEITDDITLKQAVTVKNDITSFINKADKSKTETTEPIRNVINAFYKKVKEVLDPAIEAKTNITQKIVEYENKKEKERLAEIARINAIVNIFTDPLTRIPKTKKECEDSIEKVQIVFNSLKFEDKSRSEVISACHHLISVLQQEIKAIEEHEILELEKARLAEIQAKQDAEAVKQEQERQRLEAQKRQQEKEDSEKAFKATQERILAKAEQEKRESEAQANIQVKTKLKTYVKFEIVDPSLVPRQYCEPSDKLINAAKTSGVRDIPGIRFYEERK